MTMVLHLLGWCESCELGAVLIAYFWSYSLINFENLTKHTAKFTQNVETAKLL